MAELEFHNSKYYTADEMDERLRKGTYDDAVKAGFTRSKEEFDSQIARAVSSSEVTGLDDGDWSVNRKIGTTEQRPILKGSSVGYYYFDTTINKPIWWDGVKWINSTGTEV